MNHRSLAFFVAAVGSFAAGNLAHAEVLLMDRVKQEHGMNAPARGMSMAQVESRYGAPMNKEDPRGGDTRLHPVINRWVYPEYTVYFERDRVISSVMNKGPNEVGLKNAPPPQRQ
jgi:hypothetical protein